jgi:hypothetical protein
MGDNNDGAAPEEHNEDYVWRSCCTYIDGRVMQFLVQSLVCSLVVCFCMYMLFRSEECTHQQLYSGILTMVLGVFIPNPKIH